MDLYIVNCTKQRQIINLRLPEQEKLVPFIITVGEQKPIVHGETKDNIEVILSQLKHYKLINMADIDSSKGTVNSLCYSIKSVSAEKIAQAVESNDNELDKRSSKIMDETAIAANNMMEDILKQAGATIKNTGIEIEEVVPLGSNKKTDRNKKVEVSR